MVIIDFEKLAKKDYIIALCLGLLSIGVTSPVNYMGIISGICAFFAYLVAAPITILAWKRDLFTAMGVHFIYDLISMSLLKK